MTRPDGKVAIYVVLTPEMKDTLLKDCKRVGAPLSNFCAQMVELGYRVWLEEGQSAFENRGI